MVTAWSRGKRSITASSSSTATNATLPPRATPCTAPTRASAFGAEGAMMLTKASIRLSRKAPAIASWSTGTSRTAESRAGPAASSRVRP